MHYFCKSEKLLIYKDYTLILEKGSPNTAEKGHLRNMIWRIKYFGGRLGRNFGLTRYGRKGEARVKDKYCFLSLFSLAAARAI